MGATNFRTLSDLAFHVNFAQPVVSSSEDGENLVEEAKVEGDDSLRQMSESLT